MVDMQNVDSPITLLGLGRSGTSIISKAFSVRPDFEDLSETGGLIFGAWQSAKSTFIPAPAEEWKHWLTDPELEYAFLVRKCICSISQLDTPSWFHKPAGLPIWHLDLSSISGNRTQNLNIPMDWYWRVFRKSFPNSKYIMPVRNPFDVAISRHKHTGWRIGGVISSYAAYSELMMCNLDIFSSIIPFEDLHENFASTIEQLCEDLEIQFDPIMLSVAKNYEAPISGATQPNKTYKDDWDIFDGMEIKNIEMRMIKKFFDALGLDLEIPKGIKLRS